MNSTLTIAASALGTKGTFAWLINSSCITFVKSFSKPSVEEVLSIKGMLKLGISIPTGSPAAWKWYPQPKRAAM
ncbi:MAG: hypothetical protein JRJ15_05315 [Deltaproteobacteria bacterium]|nr:hypothetical protein [Deltaproteobacteria bacterium]